MWLGEQITSRGIGNGISLIIFSGIVAGLPSGIAAMLELGRTGQMSTFLVLGILVMALGVIAFIVLFERAQRRLLIQYPKRQVGQKVFRATVRICRSSSTPPALFRRSSLRRFCCCQSRWQISAPAMGLTG
jgi:preprotein translocase subunit SecY